MPAIKPIIPTNLKLLWAEEDAVMGWSMQMMADPDRTYLLDHLELVETYMDCIGQLRQQSQHGDYHWVFMGLFLRTFDAFGRCVRSALSGDYTTSAAMARDLLETQFLISYLQDDPERPEQWLRATKKELKETFSPWKIRVELDKRDGFKEQKRKASYDLLSVAASHPTPMSFQMKADSNGKLGCGPQRNPDLLEGCLQEAARQAMMLGACLVLYAVEFPDGDKASSRLSLMLQKLRSVYFGSGE